MAILCRLHNAYGDRLINGIRAALPGEEIRLWPEETGDPTAIEICAVNRMPPGFLKPFRNLRFISGVGAGVDHFVTDPDFPHHIPLARIVDPEFSARMADYVLTWVLFHHRDMPDFLRAQQERRWAYTAMRSAREVRVGVLGLGQMGGVAAERLAAQGYRVCGWSRSPRGIPGVRSFTGTAALPAMLAESEILVNLLPLTEATRGILNAETFAAMPRGSVVISAGRGQHLVEEDLIPALDSGQLRGATLDVFRKEPLPEDHPFWTHPRIFVTPHVSTTATLESIIEGFAGNVRRFRRGEPLINLVDSRRGY